MNPQVHMCQASPSREYVPHGTIVTVTFAERLKKAHELRGGSAYALAQRVRMTPQHVGRMLKGERGTKRPPHETIVAFADALQVSFDWLAKEKGPMLLNEGTPQETTPDKYQHRAEARDLALKAGVLAAAVDYVCSEDLGEDKPVLFWFDQMRSRHAWIEAHRPPEPPKRSRPRAIPSSGRPTKESVGRSPARDRSARS